LVKSTTFFKAGEVHDFDSTQNYALIVKNHSIENPFVDSIFPACNQSVYYSEFFMNNLIIKNLADLSGGITWRRAKDLAEDAQFAVDDEGRSYLSPDQIDQKNYIKYFQTSDLAQGSIGNCWFISAATGLTQNYNLLKKVAPFENSFQDSNYTGWLF
jgi:hypothetical protein